MEKISGAVDKDLEDEHEKLVKATDVKNTKEKWMIYKLNKHRYLFRELSRLLKRLGYLKGKTLGE